MQLRKRSDGWWVEETPELIDNMGSYATKAEANDALRGLEDFLKHENSGIGTRFWTSDPKWWERFGMTSPPSSTNNT